jgi:hypothetical protein
MVGGAEIQQSLIAHGWPAGCSPPVGSVANNCRGVPKVLDKVKLIDIVNPSTGEVEDPDEDGSGIPNPFASFTFPADYAAGGIKLEVGLGGRMDMRDWRRTRVGPESG